MLLYSMLSLHFAGILIQGNKSTKKIGYHVENLTAIIIIVMVVVKIVSLIPAIF